MENLAQLEKMNGICMLYTKDGDPTKAFFAYGRYDLQSKLPPGEKLEDYKTRDYIDTTQAVIKYENDDYSISIKNMADIERKSNIQHLYIYFDIYIVSYGIYSAISYCAQYSKDGLYTYALPFGYGIDNLEDYITEVRREFPPFMYSAVIDLITDVFNNVENQEHYDNYINLIKTERIYSVLDINKLTRIASNKIFTPCMFM